jgi:hypothetical protein
MSTESRIDLHQGTLDMLILRTLLFGPAHGHAIAAVLMTGSCHAFLPMADVQRAQSVNGEYAL